KSIVDVISNDEAAGMPAIVALRDIEVIRVKSGQRSAHPDRAAAEEPLEVRLHGKPFSVIMRTPGADRELAAGFLLSERVIDRSDDLGTIEHCGNPGEDDSANVVNVTLVDAARVERAFEGKRHVTTGSSCGMCGRTTIQSLAVDVAPLPVAWTIASDALVPMPDRLRASQ